MMVGTPTKGPPNQSLGVPGLSRVAALREAGAPVLQVRALETLGLTIPPSLPQRADQVIEWLTKNAEARATLL
jgi:hypothetical protein